MDWNIGEFALTDAATKVDVRRTYELLSQTYWSVRRPYDVVQKMIGHSLCFALLRDDVQVGFGRAVTDYTVFSWIADIVVEPRYRGQGLGKWMMSCIMEHPALRGTQFVLQTRDAHALYERCGFSRSEALMSTAVEGL